MSAKDGMSAHKLLGICQLNTYLYFSQLVDFIYLPIRLLSNSKDGQQLKYFRDLFRVVTNHNRTRKQAKKPQANGRCCWWFSFLTPGWHFPSNTHSQLEIFLVFTICYMFTITQSFPTN